MPGGSKGDEMSSKIRKIGNLFLIVFAVLTILLTGFVQLVHWSNQLLADKPYRTEAEAAAYFIERHYLLADLSADELLRQYSSVEDMVQSLKDPYSALLDHTELDHAIEDLNGSYVGVGFEAHKMPGEYLQILSVENGSPAMKAGLRSGDSIIQINGEDTRDMSRDQTLSLIKGEEGTEISLTVQRNNRTHEVYLTRSRIESAVVQDTMLSDSVGYLSLTRFPMMIYKDLAQAIRQMQNQNMEKLILDLRGNGGGEIEEVAMIASLLLPKEISEMFIVNHKTQDPTIYGRTQDSLFCGPIYILVNEDTASAAELLTQILQNAGAATVIGEQTYGKGVSQSFFYLNSGNVLKLTTGEVFAPSCRPIQNAGSFPDFQIEMDNRLVSSSFINRPQLEWTRYLEGLEPLFSEQYGKDNALGQLKSGDVQLQAALEMAG